MRNKRQRRLIVAGSLAGIVSVFSFFALVFDFLFGNVAGASANPPDSTYYVAYSGTFIAGIIIFVLCKRLAKKEK